MATATKERRKSKSDSVTLDYASLVRAVKIASHAVSTRPSSTALGSVCIGGGLVSGCTVGEYRVDVDLLEAQCQPMLLPQNRLAKILQNSSHEDVTLTADGSTCVVRIGRGEWRLPTEDAAQFPLWEPNGLHPMPSLPSDQFERAARHVIYAVDKDSSRFALGGVLIEAIGDKMHFVATDGRRLSVATCGHDKSTDDFVTEPKGLQKQAPIVPVRPLSQLINQCSRDLAVTMQCGPGVFVCNIGDVTVTAATIQGRFANWKDVFPTQLPPGNSVLRDVFDCAVKAASVVTSDDSRGVQFCFKGGTLTLKAKSAEGGQSKVECDVSDYQSDASVALNSSYVAQFLKPFDKDSEPCVTVHVCHNDGKTVLTVGDAYRGVIMPLALD